MKNGCNRTKNPSKGAILSNQKEKTSEYALVNNGCVLRLTIIQIHEI